MDVLEKPIKSNVLAMSLHKILKTTSAGVQSRRGRGLMDEEQTPKEPQLADPAEKARASRGRRRELARSDGATSVKKEGFRTDRAMDGNEALRKAEALSPDLMILDFHASGQWGGYEVLRELQSSGMGSIPCDRDHRASLDRKNVEMVRP